MKTTGFEVGHWVEMFREIGLDDERMHRWHALFERRWPEAHRSFLEWLSLPGTEVDRIRASSRGEWSG